MFLKYPHHIYLNPAKNQISIAAPGMDLSAGHGTTAVLAHSGMAKVAVLDAIKGINRDNLCAISVLTKPVY